MGYPKHAAAYGRETLDIIEAVLLRGQTVQITAPSGQKARSWMMRFRMFVAACRRDASHRPAGIYDDVDFERICLIAREGGSLYATTEGSTVVVMPKAQSDMGKAFAKALGRHPEDRAAKVEAEADASLERLMQKVKP